MKHHMGSTENFAPMQSAYRAPHSTETAMTRVVNDLLTAADNKTSSMLLSMDISDWGCSRIASFVFIWQQTVHHSWWTSIQNCEDDNQDATSLVLGPLIFSSIFTTLVGTLISTFGISYHQFADNTQLNTMIKLKANGDLVALSKCADAVTGWHIENDLLLNAAKTETLSVSIRQQIAKLDLSGWYGGFRINCTFRQENVSTNSNTEQLYDVQWPHPIMLSRRATTTWAPYATSVCWSPKMSLTSFRVKSFGPDWTIM